MKIHDIIENCVEWVAYDGVLGELSAMLVLWFEPPTPSPYLVYPAPVEAVHLLMSNFCQQ